MNIKINLDKPKHSQKTLIYNTLESKQLLADLFQDIWIQKWSLEIIKYPKIIKWVFGMMRLDRKKKKK